jgi:hypothetical protein
MPASGFVMLSLSLFRASDNLAVVDYTKAGVSCDAAIEKCPTKCIVRL